MRLGGEGVMEGRRESMGEYCIPLLFAIKLIIVC